jgi:hypothetical protein
VNRKHTGAVAGRDQGKIYSPRQRNTPGDGDLFSPTTSLLSQFHHFSIVYSNLEFINEQSHSFVKAL